LTDSFPPCWPSVKMISLQIAVLLVCAITFGEVNGQLSAAVKQAFVDVHNSLRSKVALGQQSGQPGASNMEAVIWNDDIAARVQAWLDSNPCSTVAHDYTALGKEGYGENGYGGTGTAVTDDASRIKLAQAAANLWFSEVSAFTYPATSSGTTGHYTQVVWADSNEVGCGFSTCPSSGKVRVYCDYTNGGNYPGQAPYQTGTKCSKCPSYRPQCTADGLCTSPASTAPRKQCYHQVGYSKQVNIRNCAPWYNSCGVLNWTDFGDILYVGCTNKANATCASVPPINGMASQWCTCDGNLCNPCNKANCPGISSTGGGTGGSSAYY
jgi:hypothetical protein